ncbi:MAG: hypothetical protein AAB922_07005, partial [Patescibacteria group bacterium]
ARGDTTRGAIQTAGSIADLFGVPGAGAATGLAGSALGLARGNNIAGALPGLLRAGGSVADLFPATASVGGLPVSSAGAQLAAETALAAGEPGVPVAAGALGSTGGSLASTLGAGASMVGAMYGGLQGLSSLFGGETEREKALGAIQLLGAAASPFTFGLSNLAAPITAFVTENMPWHPGAQIFNTLFGEGDYRKRRVEANELGYGAARSIVGGYAEAARSGDPAAGLTALQAAGGDLPNQARQPVRSELDPATAQAIGVPAAFRSMSPEDYQKMLAWFAEEPSRLTAARGRELGGTGQGAIQGSGDVGYLDQQGAQQLASTMASTAQRLIQAQLLQFGEGPKLDEVRAITLLKSLPSERLSTLPVE